MNRLDAIFGENDALASGQNLNCARPYLVICTSDGACNGMLQTRASCATLAANSLYGHGGVQATLSPA